MAVDQPWLSVIVPVYQGERYLDDMFTSIADQSDDGLEVLVVDDGSTDESASIIAKWQARLAIRLLSGERSGNWVAATNRGLTVAKGTWISLLHQDDAWLPGRLKHLRGLITQSPAANIILHPARLIDESGVQIGQWRCPLPAGHLLEPGFVLPRLIIQNFIPICSPVFRRELALSIGPLNEELWYFADWDYWLRLSTRGGVVYDAAPMASFRIHPASQTAQRTRDITDVCDQFDRVTNSAIRHPAFPGAKKAQARRMQQFAREAYAFMLATLHHQPRPWRALLIAASRVGPSGWWRYLYYSRIVDRLLPRVRLLGRR